MDIHSARRWIIVSSLIISTVAFIFFLLAPALDLLLFEQSFRLIQIVFPVFMGYLASAAHFVFSAKPAIKDDDAERQAHIGRHSDLAGLLIKWPIIIFGILLATSIGAFAYTNRENATLNTGMTVDQLALVISVCLGLLAATTNVAVSYLFSVGVSGSEK